MCVILHAKLASMSTARADTDAWKNVQAGKLLLIGLRLAAVQTGRPQAESKILLFQ